MDIYIWYDITTNEGVVLHNGAVGFVEGEEVGLTDIALQICMIHMIFSS